MRSCFQTPIKSSPGTYAIKILLKKRKNKNALDFEVVRMQAEVRVEKEMVGEGGNEGGMARQLGAVYGLFRVSRGFFLKDPM